MAEETTNFATGEITGTTGENSTQTMEGVQSSTLTTEAIEKLIQSRVDKITADLGKKNSTLQKELDKMKKEKMSEEEVRNLELADKEKALAEKEQALLERENKLYAIKAMKEIGLDDGSQQSLELLDFVMSDDEKTIKERVKTFKSLVDRFVTAKVEQTFKANGRVPNSGTNSNGGRNAKDNIAAELGKRAAETAKKSNEILNYYYGGK